MTKHRVFTKDEYDLLTDEEKVKFAHLTDEVFKFETTFLAAIVVAFIIGAIAAIADLQTVFIIAGICFVGFIIVAWFGSDWHHARFNRLLFEAIDKHKEKT